MQRIIAIEGMMCNGCVNRVKNSLEQIDGVQEVNVSLEDKKAIVTLNANVSNDELKSAVEDLDFKVTSIEE